MTNGARDIPSSLSARRWFFPLVCTAVLGVALWVMTRAWNASLLDRFQFRQTQTALTSYWIQRDGFHLAYPMPVFGPPWSAPLEFPLYQWLVATLADGTGLSLVSAARSVGILFFLLSLPAVYGLGKLVEPDPRRRLLIPAVLLTAPVCLFYSRSFMIESCAATLAVWFLYVYLRSLQRPDWGWTAATLITGILAALVKVNTFVIFGVPAVLYTLNLLRKVAPNPNAQASPMTMNWRRIVLAAVVPALPILGATIAWIHFTDSVKRANPLSVMLVSSNLVTWNFGTWAQRLDPTFWKFVGHEWSVGSISLWATLPLAAGLLLVAAPYRRAALWCAAGFFTGPLVFTNLFTIHEYYYFPSAYFSAAAAGIILAGLFANQRFSATVKITALALFFVIQAINFNTDYAATLKNPPVPPPPMVDVVRRATASDEVVLVYGWDWNALIPYYAERRAILIPPSKENDTAALQEILSRLKPGQVSALVLQGDRKKDAAFVKWCTSLLDLSATAVARSPDGDVYIAANRVDALKASIAGSPEKFPGVEFDFSNPTERPDPRLIYQKPEAGDYAAVASPAPFAVYNPWTVQVAPIGGEPGISASAPSELHFHAPPGATSIEATVGIIEGAYIPPNATDGIDVVIFELQPGGGRRILFHRFLNPVVTPADRGLQTISLTNLSPITGPLVFGLYPGPADNFSYDWGYWRKISIK